MNGEKPTRWGSADGSSGRESLDHVQSSKTQKVMGQHCHFQGWTWGWGTSPSGKMLDLKEKDLSPVPRRQCKTLSKAAGALGRLRWANPLGSMDSLPSLVGNAQAMRYSISEQTNKKGRGHLRNNT